jgi:hypothetical protein
VKKVCLLVSPPISDGSSLARGFERCGWEARLLTFEVRPPYPRKAGAVPWKSRRRAGGELGGDLDSVLLEGALPLAESAGADLIFVLRPDGVREETLSMLSRFRGVIASWAIDTFERFPEQNALSQVTRADFVLDGGDALEAKQVWLPMGVEEGFLSTAEVKKDLDVLFIGNLELPYYATRRSRLEDLIHSDLHKRYRLGAVVRGGGWLPDHLLKWRAPFPISRPLEMGGYCGAIAGAEICINVCQDDGKANVNSAFLLVPGCRTCALVDKRDYLTQWLVPEVHFSWFEDGAMIEKLEALLGDRPRTRSMAEEGWREVTGKHTYAHRARTILDRLGFR